MTQQPIITEDMARGILVQIDLMKKQKGSGWEWRDLEIRGSDNEARVLAKFNVSTPTVQHWFKKATANVFRMEHQRSGWWLICFDLIPVEVDNVYDLWSLG